MRAPGSIALCGLAMSCVSAEKPTWRLVGFYDATTLLSQADPSGASAKLVSWSVSPEMSQRCGPPGSPLGLGVPDTVAMASRLTPTLAVLLAREEDGEVARLSRDDLLLQRVTDQDAAPIRLEPAVMPYALRVSVNGGADDRLDAQDWMISAVQQQVATSICLEHKMGRAWTGGDREQVTEALLINERGAELSADLYYVGLGAPVPPLLGPETACIVDPEGEPTGRPVGLDSDAELEPGDVWNASLPRCEDASAPMATSQAPVYFGSQPLTEPLDDAWSTLAVTVAGESLSYSLNGQPRLLSQQLSAYQDATSAEGNFPDVIGSLTRYYPTLHDLRASGMQIGQGGKSYALLIVPAWQLHGAEAQASDADAVGEVLSAPETVSVVVKGEDQWWEINPYRINPHLARLNWGYPLGGDVVEGPVAAVGAQPLSGAESSDAYRAPVQGIMAAAFVVIALLISGSLRRVSDLWRRAPELRLERWVERPPRGDAP